MRSVKSREKKLQDRMGLEKSAKGTRFKLNRDLAGYHLTSRADVVVERGEMELSWKIPPPPEIRGGVLVSLENASVGYGRKVILEGINLSIHPGSRLAIVGSVCPSLISPTMFDLCTERTGEIDVSKIDHLRLESLEWQNDNQPFHAYWLLLPTHCRIT